MSKTPNPSTQGFSISVTRKLWKQDWTHLLASWWTNHYWPAQGCHLFNIFYLFLPLSPPFTKAWFVVFHFYTVLITHVILCDYFSLLPTMLWHRFYSVSCTVFRHLKLGICLVHYNTQNPSKCHLTRQKNQDGTQTSYCSDTFRNLYSAFKAMKLVSRWSESHDCAQLNTPFWKTLRPPSGPCWHCRYWFSSPIPMTSTYTGGL